MRGAGPKFRRRAEARPDEVLDAALALFIEKGFAATRVEDIAARAGLSKGAVYLYFPSQGSDPRGAGAARGGADRRQRAGHFSRIYAGDPRPVISAVLKMVAARLADPKLVAIPRLLIREMIHFPEFAAMYRREVLDRVIPVVERLIRNGIEEGYFRAGRSGADACAR